MRPYLVLVLPLLAAPVAAQQRAIGPAPSPLFARPAAVADTGTPHEGIPVVQARVIGGLSGLLIGIGLAEVVESHNPSSGDDGGLDRAVSYGLVGMLVGVIVGPMLLSE